MHNTYAVLYTQAPLASTANVSADKGIARARREISKQQSFFPRPNSLLFTVEEVPKPRSIASQNAQSMSNTRNT
jgi:hypothetical protein